MYAITIKQTVTKEVPVGRQWKPISEQGGKTEYGYTPETPELTQVQVYTTEIYSQEVEKLDLVAVILAINDICI